MNDPIINLGTRVVNNYLIPLGDGWILIDTGYAGGFPRFRKRLEKQGYVKRVRPENNERQLFISLTEAGEALKDEAVKVPEAMGGCIDLPEEELWQLKRLLDKALSNMRRTRE